VLPTPEKLRKSSSPIAERDPPSPLAIMFSRKEIISEPALCCRSNEKGPVKRDYIEKAASFM
jgi:hypothetical protein